MRGFFFMIKQQRHFLLFISLILLIPFLRSFGGIDIIGVHWLVLPIVILFLIIIHWNSFELPQKNLIFYSYSVFLSLSTLSLFYSFNITLTIIDLSRIATTFLLFLLFNFFLNRYKPNFLSISICVSSVLFLESLFSVYPFFIEIFYFFNDKTISLAPNDFMGIAANKNITAASLAIKLPFLLYFFYKAASKKYFLIFIIPFFTVFTAILFLNTRSVFLSVSLFIVLTVFYLIFSKIKLSIRHSLVLLSLALSFLSNAYFSNSTAISRASSINISSGASSGRFELWSNAIDFFVKHPIIGCGLGNWKVESLPYWSKLQSGYIVPYHAHNDFLELLTELGIIGFLSYFFIFVSIFYLLTSSLLKSKKEFHFFILICSSLFYFTDAFFNFPLERTIMQIMFAFILALTSYYSFKNEA